MIQASGTYPEQTADEAASEHARSWHGLDLQTCHNDFDLRVVSRPQDARWLPTALQGVDARVFEYVPGDNPRLSAQFRFQHGHTTLSQSITADLEVLIQQGSLRTMHGTHHRGMYFRLPVNQRLELSDIQLEDSGDQTHPALIYLAAGHMPASDSEIRELDTQQDSHWLPGPVDGTRVLPLHGHGTANVMLIRWTEGVSFKPRLDPRGEEILVLQGTLFDEWGQYPANTWLRNPIVAWQPWGAQPGTVIYYKSGHFNLCDDTM